MTAWKGAIMDAKERIIEQLKRSGCRVTKQRLMLIDVILEGKCNCCKEIYYKAVKIDPSIGTATVYRMINTLEEIGAISRNTMYHIACSDKCAENPQCRIELTDGTKLQLDTSQWHEIVRLGLKASGFRSDAPVKELQWETVQT